MNNIWIVFDSHGEIIDLCADELTAYAVKKSTDDRLIENCTVKEHQLTTRADVENVIVFTPEDEGMDEYTVEKCFDA